MQVQINKNGNFFARRIREMNILKEKTQGNNSNEKKQNGKTKLIHVGSNLEMNITMDLLQNTASIFVRINQRFAIYDGMKMIRSNETLENDGQHWSSVAATQRPHKNTDKERK
jgi:hypothetical protein